MLKRLLYSIMTLLLLVTGQVFGITFEDKQDLRLDSSLINTEKIEYAQPDSIVICPLSLPSHTKINSQEWIKGIYYYSVSRLGYPDIPFHYIVLPTGKIYKMSSVGDEYKVAITESPESNPIFIAYLVDSNEVDFTSQAKESLQDLVLQIANNNSIESTNIDISSLKFTLNKNTKTSSLALDEISGRWDIWLATLQSFVSASYAPQTKTHKLELVEIKLPTTEMAPGNVALVDIVIKNIGEYSIYPDSTSSLYLSKVDGTLSKFFLNGVWASQSQVPILNTNQILKPQEQATFQVKLNVPLYFGAQTESFVIKNGLGEIIEGTNTEIALTVSSIEETVVEILPTSTGYLNVRSADSGNAEVISRVSPGERYILKQRGQFGYVQIDLGENKLGWVSQQYVKQVN